jgi:uncharacterized protein
MGCNAAPPKIPFCRKQFVLSIYSKVFYGEKRYNASTLPLICRKFTILPAANAMKLQANLTQHYQTVTAYDDESVEINAVRFSHSLIVLPEVTPTAWPPTSFDALTAEHFAQIDAAAPDVVILGTGKRQRFVHPRLTAALSARHIGVECMDNGAACRTYNILMGEGRKVALALIFD